MRHQAGRATVAVGEGVHPKQAVMETGNGDETISSAKPFRRTIVESRHPTSQFARRRRDMVSDFGILAA
jgi:hypothetical protein